MTLRHLALLAAGMLGAGCADGGNAPAASGKTADTPGATGTAPRPASGAVTHWQCAETGVAHRMDASGNTLLFLSGRTRVLPPASARSGDGPPKPAAPSDRFAISGRTATLVLDGAAPVSCTPADRPSPWFEAATRGVVVRGVGNEPGWFVEIRGGNPATLHAALDYGERVLDLAPAVPDDADPARWSAATADGTRVVLVATREPCVDGMSGARFEARILLAAGDDDYAGCGAFLDDFDRFTH
jgi:uncharacterized membrane protein